MRTSRLFQTLLAVSALSAATLAQAGTWVFGTYNHPTDGMLTRGYEVYIPTSYRAGTAVPLVVALHGCAETPQTFEYGARFTALAEQRGFIVLYPAQASASNPSLCWNWYYPTNQVRGGEPGVIKGIVDRIKSQYSIDARRVYTTGISAGGAMASILAACYSDVFAAAAVHSGPMYKAATTLVGATNAMLGLYNADANYTGTQAWQCSGSPTRPMPMMVFQGLSDGTVKPINGDQVIKQSAQVNDLGDDRADNNTVVSPARSSTLINPGGGKYTYYVEKVNKGGKDILVQYRVNSMGHAWSGGRSGAAYSDPLGPDATTIMYDWFLTHTR